MDGKNSTAKTTVVDPQAYLRYVLERIADYPINRVAELPPWNVADALHDKHKLELAA